MAIEWIVGNFYIGNRNLRLELVADLRGRTAFPYRELIFLGKDGLLYFTDQEGISHHDANRFKHIIRPAKPNLSDE